MSDAKQTSWFDIGGHTPTAKERAKDANKRRRAAKAAARPEDVKARGALHVRLMDLYVRELKRVRCLDSVLIEPADGIALELLIDKFEGDEDRLVRIVMSTYAHPLQSQMATIRDIARHPAKYERLASVSHRQASSSEASERGRRAVEGPDDL